MLQAPTLDAVANVSLRDKNSTFDAKSSPLMLMRRGMLPCISHAFATSSEVAKRKRIAAVHRIPAILPVSKSERIGNRAQWPNPSKPPHGSAVGCAMRIYLKAWHLVADGRRNGTNT